MKLAILDDYQNVALTMADWTGIQPKVDITVFNQHLGDEEQVIEALQSFDVICCMRERTPFPSGVLTRLPRLKLLVSSGAKNASIDINAAERLGIEFMGTQSPGHAASELAWGLLMSLARNIHIENSNIRQGKWQSTIGSDLKGQTLGILGLGRHGSNMARFAQAFGMKIIAWSQNLNEQRCHELNVEYVDKKSFFQHADFVSIHLKMGARNVGIVGKQEFHWMKSSAYLINTSRGPIIDECSLIKALKNNEICGAALDVYDEEPIPSNHEFLNIPNVLLTSHVGFVTSQTYAVFYGQMVEKIFTWVNEREC